MEMRLEVVPVPVADVDRAKAFYAEQVGFDVDFDTQAGNETRFVQLTPPGSSCSIVVGTGMGEISDMVPGSLKGLTLVVPDVASARAALGGRGVEVGEIIEYPRGIKMAHFHDPDGNSWALQEVPPDLGQRQG
jgi:predicted enzyme related to lactoylglutathione lyase